MSDVKDTPRTDAIMKFLRGIVHAETAYDKAVLTGVEVTVHELERELAAASAECERMRQELDHARDWLKESRENGHRLLEAADGWKLSAAEWQKRAESAEADAERIARLSWPIPFFDSYGDVDIHQQACVYASALGRDEPNRDDYIAAARDAIDAARGKA